MGYDPDEMDDLNNPDMAIPTKYLQWRSHPSAIKRGFSYITKDLVLSNLDDSDVKLLRLCFDLLQQNLAAVEDKVLKMSDIEQANDFLEQLVNVICASSVGYKGFGRSLDTTMIQVKDIRREDVTKKGKMQRGYR